MRMVSGQLLTACMLKTMLSPRPQAERVGATRTLVRPTGGSAADPFQCISQAAGDCQAMRLAGNRFALKN